MYNIQPMDAITISRAAVMEEIFPVHKVIEFSFVASLSHLRITHKLELSKRGPKIRLLPNSLVSDQLTEAS
jgi:hypothetical protein